MNRLIIEADRSESAYWSDLWRFRELFFFLSWRDILVRYKQTAIGVLWAVIRPLLTMIVFTIVFGKLARLPSEGIPYPVLVYAATLPWQFFASALSEASNSLLINSNMLSKIYFPRIIVPASAVIVSFVDFLIAALILVGLMVWYSVAPSWRLFTLPLFTVLALFAALGSSLWLAALNVRYRDFRFVIPFIVQFGFFVSPVGYSSSVVSQRAVEYSPQYGEVLYRLYAINPMVGVIDGFRWAIGGASVPLDWVNVLISFVVVTFITGTGLRYFRSTERTFADII